MRKIKDKIRNPPNENGTILEVSKNVRIEKNLHSLLKILAVKKDVNLEDLANVAIARYLEAEAELEAESIKP